MLIPHSQIQNILLANNIKLNGVLHVGAHECEELPFYNHIGITADRIIWIDAIDRKVIEAKNKGIQNIYNAVVTDKDDEEVVFNVSNNDQSSSVLEFGTHSTEHPWVVYVDKIQKKSITLNSFFERNNIDVNKYDFWNFDIQGAELMALKGASKYLPNVKVLYLEVNEKELYKDCGLIGDIDQFLSQYNFKRVITNITKHGWGDAVYIKSTQTASLNDEVIDGMRINMVKYF